MAHRQQPGEVRLWHWDRHGILIELNVTGPAWIDQQPPPKMDFTLRNDLIVPHHCSNRLPVIALLVRAVVTASSMPGVHAKSIVDVFSRPG